MYHEKNLRVADDTEWPEQTFKDSTKFTHQAGGYLNHSAYILSPGEISLALYSEFFKSSGFMYSNDENVFTSATFNFRFSPVEHFETAFWVSNSTNNNNRAQEIDQSPELLQVLGELGLLLKGSFDIHKSWVLSTGLKLDFVPEIGGTSLDMAGTRVTFQTGASFIAPKEAKLPVRLHLNADLKLKHDPEGDEKYRRIEEYAFKIERVHRLFLGMGMDFNLDSKLMPFLEYRMGIAMGNETLSDLLARTRAEDKQILGVEETGDISNTKFFSHEISFGAAYNGFENLSMHLGFVKGFSPLSIQGIPERAPYKLAFGLSYNIPYKRKVLEDKSIRMFGGGGGLNTATLKGKVVIVGGNKSDTPEGIQMYFDPNPFGTGFITTKDGRFNISGIPPGTYKVLVRGDTINDLKGRLKFKPGEELKRNLKVKLRPKKTDLIVQCVDGTNGQGIHCNGILKPVNNKLLKNLKIKSKKKGMVITKVPSGEYDIEMFAGEQKARPMKTILLPRQRVILAAVFQGLKLPESVTFEGNRIKTALDIRFDTNFKNVKSESHEQLKDLARALKIKSDIKLKIIGHSDSRGKGKDLIKRSQSLAEIVQKYLVSQGIAIKRIIIEGRGSKEPISSNRTRVGRQQNNRVEFERL